jgi:hypothetical protein
MIAEGGCDSKTGERSEGDEMVKDGMEWEASAKSLIRNSGRLDKREVHRVQENVIPRLSFSSRSTLSSCGTSPANRTRPEPKAEIRSFSCALEIWNGRNHQTPLVSLQVNRTLEDHSVRGVSKSDFTMSERILISFSGRTANYNRFSSQAPCRQIEHTLPNNPVL